MAPPQEASQHVSNIEEYFRKNFRKINARQALDVLEPLGEDTTQKAAALDGTFWPWETLEEAVRGNLNQFNDKEFLSVLKAFNANYKGSRDLLDLLEQRVYFDGKDDFKI